MDAVVVDVDAVGVGVAGGIEPVARHVFGMGGSGHHGLGFGGDSDVGIFLIAFHEGVGRFGGRWQACQVERQAAVEAARFFGRIRFQSGRFQLVGDEAINRVR